VPGRSLLFALLLSASIGTLAVPATAQPQVPPAPHEHRWGINDSHLATGLLPDAAGRLPDSDLLLRAREAGFGWVRYYLYWNYANPKKDEYYWWLSDVEIARLEAAGFKILVQVMYPPTWTTGVSYPNSQSGAFCQEQANMQSDDCTNGDKRPGYRAEYTPNNYPPGYDRSGDFRTFATAAVDRYKGRVHAWGFSVEVHNKVFWMGTGRQMIDEVLRPGYEIVKAIDPSALVVGPDEDVEDSLDFMLKLEADDVAAGKSRLFDVITSHGFAHSGWQDPSYLDIEWRQGFFGTHCSFETHQDEKNCSTKNIVQRYRNGRPFWFTEFGYQTPNPASIGGQQAAAAYLTSWIQGLGARSWVDKAFVFALRYDNMTGTDFGMFANTPETPELPVLGAVRNAIGGAWPTPKQSYLAEGATGHFFDLDVCVANPHPVPVQVKVSFLKPDGSVDVVSELLKASSRTTYRVEQLPGLPSLASTAVSTVVESPTGASLITERSMFWDATYYSGHGGTAVAAPATTWYFGEGSQGFFDTFVLLANPGAVTANVTVTFLRELGETPVTHQVTVGPTSRENVWAVELGDQLLNKSFAIRVDSDVPIIAERAMYFGAVPSWYGGHESAGVSSLSTTWFHAEGATGSFFDEYILIGNPGDTDADVTFTFLLLGAPPVVARAKVPTRERFTLNVEGAEFEPRLQVLSGDVTSLRSAALSVKVESTVPIVSERAMYWEGGFTTWTEAHNAFGVTEPGVKWGLAEGRRGGPLAFETYILIANPSDQDANVTVTFLKPDGTTMTGTQTVPAQSRANWAGDMPAAIPGQTAEFGAVIESTNGVPIVVERAMYWNAATGQHWAGGTNATATKLQ
jgi:hypothetical protein